VVVVLRRLAEELCKGCDVHSSCSRQLPLAAGKPRLDLLEEPAVWGFPSRWHFLPPGLSDISRYVTSTQAACPGYPPNERARQNLQVVARAAERLGTSLHIGIVATGVFEVADA
jgi:hypothetical protein